MKDDAHLAAGFCGRDVGSMAHQRKAGIGIDETVPAAEIAQCLFSGLADGDGRDGGGEAAVDVPSDIAPIHQQRANPVDDDGLVVELSRVDYRHGGASLRQQHRRAGRLAVFQIAVGLRRIGKRIGLTDVYFDRAGADDIK